MVTWTHDAACWFRKWSTGLAALSMVLDAVVLGFIAGPPEWRAGFPVSFGVGILIASMAVKGLIPLATSVQQKSLPTMEPK